MSDIPSVAAAKAVLHPIRLRILETLDGEPRSPRSLAAELDEPLPNLSYHVKTPERLGAIELTGTKGKLEIALPPMSILVVELE